MSDKERVNALLSDYRLGFLAESSEPELKSAKYALLKMSARLKFGNELQDGQRSLLDRVEAYVHTLNPLAKPAIVNDEPALMITVTLPREEGDIPAFPKEEE
jgi:hypothetical protein